VRVQYDAQPLESNETVNPNRSTVRDNPAATDFYVLIPPGYKAVIAVTLRGALEGQNKAVLTLTHSLGTSALTIRYNRVRARSEFFPSMLYVREKKRKLKKKRMTR
jgi:hypothetical protein